MFVRLILTGAFLGSTVLGADTIQLKDKAALSGRILAEKRDLVAIDLGYTVVTVPRNQITSITHGDEEPVKGKAKETSKNRAPEPKPAATVNPLPPETPPAETVRGSEKTVRDLVQQLGEAVVQVRTPAGLGSGFFIGEEGDLITNFHVIEGETQISIEVYHQVGGQLKRGIYKQVRIVAMNKFQDLALLRIEDKDAPKFVKVPLGDSDGLAVGERVFAIGSPLGFERTVTEGIVSTKTRHYAGDLYLQTTTQINPGNSGGPLFNLFGEVVGVTNMKILFGDGLGFAIPVEAVRYFLRHRDSYAYDNDNPSNPYRYLPPPARTRKEK
jgi:serine protease Do